MRAKHFRIASVIEYLSSFVYAFLAALCYSMSDSLGWMFVVFGLIALCVGLFTETLIIHVRESNELSKKDSIYAWIVTGLSLTCILAFPFNMAALLCPAKAKTKVVVNEDYVEPAPKPEKKWYKKAPFIVSVTSLVAIIACSFVGNIVETSGYSVEVTDGMLTKADSDEYNKDQPLNGKEYAIQDPDVYLSYTVYRPKEATSTNQKPVVFVLPGFTRTKATMSQYAIELSRRGAVVFTLDPGSQGATSHGGYEYDEEGNEYVLDEAGNKIQNSYAVARSGMGYLLTYVYNNVDTFDYIDRDRIGIAGHSAGGGDACKLAADFAGNSYEESIIKALFISGYIKTSAANVFYKLRCNTVLSYAKYDEGSFRYQDENQAYEVIASRFVNEVNSKTSSANGVIDEYMIGYGYGDMDNGTYRILLQEETNHCFEMYSPESITNTTRFFREALGMETPLEDSSQVWFVKECATGLNLGFAFALIIALVSLLVSVVPFLKPLKAEADGKIEKEKEIREKYTSDVTIRAKQGTKQTDKGFAKRLLFFLPVVLTAVIACLDFIPLARLSMELFPEAANNVYTFYFPERMMNSVFLWAVVNGLIGLLLWVLTTVGENLVYLAMGKKEKVSWSKFEGLKVKPMNLLKSLGLAVVLFFVFYGVLEIVYLIFHQDFRFMLVSASPLNGRMLLTWLIYLAGFFVFYLSNSLRVNLGVALEGFKEWQVLLISALCNSLGLAFILVINYFVYFQTGTVFYGYYSPTDSNEMWLYVNMVFGLVVMMFLLPIFNRLVYKKLGNVYAGALLWCMIFIMMSLSSSISLLPL